MIIIHELFKIEDLDPLELAMIKRLEKKKILAVVKNRKFIGVARHGTNRGKWSQLAKYVREATDKLRINY